MWPAGTPALQLVAGFDLDEFGLGLGLGEGRCAGALRGAPPVHVGSLVRAGDGAQRGAGLLRQELASDVVHRVLGQRLAGIAALLRAVMNQAFFADVEVTSA